MVAHNAGFCLWLKEKNLTLGQKQPCQPLLFIISHARLWEVSSVNTWWDEAAIQPGNPSPVC